MPDLHRGRLKAFTLIELILVMTVLTIAASITAPALANFFRGRTLDSEARRILALTRQGQNRAVSEGLPMELWLDTQQGQYGLEAEPSYEAHDAQGSDFALDSDMHLELANLASETSGGNIHQRRDLRFRERVNQAQHSSEPAGDSFLPDGSFGENSPQSLRLTGRDGLSIWLVLSRNRLNYEIRNRTTRASHPQSTVNSGFTLAEVLAALVFMAILIPVALEGLHIASRAGEVATRKGEAALVAERVLNESIVTTNWNTTVQNGTVRQGIREFRWTLRMILG